MAGLDHGFGGSNGPASKGRDGEVAVARNARIGLVFFTIYLVIYCGYVGLAAFARSVMAATPVAGINVATLYGLGLIVLALVFAMAYGWACRAPSSSIDGATQVGETSSRGSSSSRSGRDA